MTKEISESRVVCKISFEFAGERLDIFVGRFFEESKYSEENHSLSRSKIQQAIENGLVLVNNAVSKKSYALRENDEVLIDEAKIREENPSNIQIIPEKINLEILWEDEHYIAINKPAGLVVHLGVGQKGGTLLNGLYYYAENSGGEKFKPILVHRLDKDTTGVIIAAKSEIAHEKLSKKFADREIYKGYCGICIGKFPNVMEGTMEFPIGRDKKDPTKKAVDYHNGKEARTDYKILRYESGIYFAQFQLHSGRTHQIRVHCANSGFPIICDNLYGGDKERIKFLEQKFRPFAIKIYDCFNRQNMPPRQALHARKASFVHPFTKREITLVAPFPEDFQKAIKLLGLSSEDL